MAFKKKKFHLILTGDFWVAYKLIYQMTKNLIVEKEKVKDFGKIKKLKLKLVFEVGRLWS